MKNLTLILIVALLSVCLHGCATAVNKTREENTVTHVVTTTETRSTTFFDSKSELAKSRASVTDKTSSSSIGALSQESSGSNVVQVLKIVVEGAGKALVP